MAAASKKQGLCEEGTLYRCKSQVNPAHVHVLLQKSSSLWTMSRPLMDTGQTADMQKPLKEVGDFRASCQRNDDSPGQKNRQCLRR